MLALRRDGEGGKNMTNILAAVVVMVLTTTNDIPRWRPQIWSDGDGGGTMYVDESTRGLEVVNAQSGVTNWIQFPAGMGPADTTSANQRVRVVQTKRIRRLTFEWEGRVREIVEEEVLAETRTILVKRESWEEER